MQLRRSNPEYAERVRERVRKVRRERATETRLRLRLLASALGSEEPETPSESEKSGAAASDTSNHLRWRRLKKLRRARGTNSAMRSLSNPGPTAQLRTLDTLAKDGSSSDWSLPDYPDKVLRPSSGFATRIGQSRHLRQVEKDPASSDSNSVPLKPLARRSVWDAGISVSSGLTCLPL